MVGFGPAVSARFAGTAHEEPGVAEARRALAHRLGEAP
jgi:hypothetical protein